MNTVTMYTQANCLFCAMAKRLLSNKGVEPVEHNVSLAPRLKEMTELTGSRALPQIFIGDKYVGGFYDLQSLERQGKLFALLLG